MPRFAVGWKVLVFTLHVGVVGCNGGVDCRTQCMKVADELTSVFGASEPCTESEWDGAETCAECDQLLLELYSVVPENSICDVESQQFISGLKRR